MKRVTDFALRRGCFAVFLVSLLFFFVGSSSAQDSWTKHGSPVLSPGAAGQWDDELVAPGTVIFQDTVYKMWYTGFDGDNMQVGYATSPDGLNWTKHSGPVLNLGISGSWEDAQVGIPMVYFDGSLYHMWYMGDDGRNERTGHATSPDGISWTKDSSNPVISLGASGKWDNWCAASGPVVFDTVFHMIYNGFSDNNTCRSGYAASSDGVQWTKASDPVLNLGNWDTPRVQVNSLLYQRSVSKYFAFYGGGDKFVWGISYATAANPGGPWTKLGSKILDATAGAWDNRFVGFPCVLCDSINNLYKMWYMGGSAEWTGSVGYATAPLTAIKGITRNAKRAFNIDQNYPNPFNPTTAISYKLSAVSHVSLKVYDILGREVATLVNEKKGPGIYEVKFDASGLSSGVYFYRIKAGAYTSVKKMLMIK